MYCYLDMGYKYNTVRDWSLIMGRGATKREAGYMKFYPYNKGGGSGKSYSHAEGGAQQVLG